MEILSERLCLRDFVESDYAVLRELETTPEIYYHEIRPPSEQDTLAFLQKALIEASKTPRQRFDLGISLRGSEEILGWLTLYLQNEEIAEYEIGWALFPRVWGQGIATEAARCMLGFAFDQLGAHRVVAYSHELNQASLSVMARLGMQPEVRYKETRRWHGKWVDILMYAILDREWQARQIRCQ